jgi:hypothetical protein
MPSSPPKDGKDANKSSPGATAHLLNPTLLVVLVPAFFAVLGTGIGASLSGYLNLKLERFKFEVGLIQKAFETGDQNEVARRLKFLVDAGLVDSLNSQQLTELAKSPDDLPRFTEAMGIAEAKSILRALGLYAGAVDAIDQPAFRDAVRAFQTSKDMMPDGIIGPMTASELRKALAGVEDLPGAQ